MGINLVFYVLVVAVLFFSIVGCVGTIFLFCIYGKSHPDGHGRYSKASTVDLDE